MQFQVSEEIFKNHPNLKLGLIILKNFNNSRRISDLESLLRGMCALTRRKIINQDLNSLPSIKAWNRAYGNFGINPEQNSPSITALLSFISSGEEIPHINTLLDLSHYYSLKHLISISTKDLDWVCDDLRLTYTKGNEPFRSIGTIQVERAKEGEAAYLDNGGVIQRFWNHRECERTKVTNKTENSAIFIEDLSMMHMDKFGEILREMKQSIRRYLGLEIDPVILNREKRVIELGVQGRKNVNDAIITQQEKAHFNQS